MNYAHIQDKLYFESGAWKCDKSPTGAHQWKVYSTLGKSEEKCKCCRKVREVEFYQTYSLYPKRKRKE